MLLSMILMMLVSTTMVIHCKSVYYKYVSVGDATDDQFSFQFKSSSPDDGTSVEVTQSNEIGNEVLDTDAMFNIQALTVNKRIDDAVVCSLLGRCVDALEGNAIR